MSKRVIYQYKGGVIQRHDGRDVRDWLRGTAHDLPIFARATHDDVASAVRAWVRANIQYRHDPRRKDDWQYPAHTLKREAGDCEDHAILTAAMLHASGIGWCCIAVCIGTEARRSWWGRARGHAWCAYRRADGAWVSLDTLLGRYAADPISALPPMRKDRRYGRIMCCYNANRQGKTLEGLA